MQRVSGIIIHQITTRRGTWFQLKSRTWVYVPEVISSLLIGSKGEFEGERRKQKGCKPFLYAHRYSVPEVFMPEKVINKVMRLLEKINFKAVNLLKIQVVQHLLIYLFVIGKIALLKRMAKWKGEKILEYCRFPYNFYLNRHLDYQSTDVVAQALMVQEVDKIYPYAHFIVSQAYKEGKEFLTVDSLYRKVLKGVRNEISFEEFRRIIEDSSRKMLVLEEDRVYLSSVYYMRKKCLEMISKRNIPSLTFSKSLPEQLKSILQWRYSVLTGTAGTGKTTLVRQLKNSGLNVKFTATVGKAAKKLDSSATTLHDLLGYPSFKVRQVDADLVVVDEASMLTWQLLYHALRKIRGHIIFVGDPEQTRAVQAAGIFKEVIENMPEGSVKKLEVVYRTVNTERVIMKLSRDEALRKVVSLAVYFERKRCSWQIITPLRRTAHDINLRIQYKLRGNGDSGIFKRGDRVMFVKNLRIDGELLAGNGQVGTVTGRDGNYWVVKFGDSTMNCLEEELSLAYAITVHKATGSEYDHVICYIPSGVNDEFLSEDLVKVANTRARVKTYFICEDSSVREKIKNYVTT